MLDTRLVKTYIYIPRMSQKLPLTEFLLFVICLLIAILNPVSWSVVNTKNVASLWPMSYIIYSFSKNRSTLIQAIVYSIAVNRLAKIIHRYLWHMASGFSPPHSSQQWCVQKRTHLQPFCSKFDIVWAGRGVFSYQSQYKSPKTFGLY